MTYERLHELGHPTDEWAISTLIADEIDGKSSVTKQDVQEAFSGFNIKGLNIEGITKRFLFALNTTLHDKGATLALSDRIHRLILFYCPNIFEKNNT